jgi:hypothetical protein
MESQSKENKGIVESKDPFPAFPVFLLEQVREVVH